MVGYIMVCMSVSSALFAYSMGILQKYVGRMVLLLSGNFHFKMWTFFCLITISLFCEFLMLLYYWHTHWAYYILFKIDLVSVKKWETVFSLGFWLWCCSLTQKILFPFLICGLILDLLLVSFDSFRIEILFCFLLAGICMHLINYNRLFM